jgi:hypothetical protein
MYANKFAAAIKCGREVLREFKDTVYVPFGAQYEIYLKNLNTVRALVTITIDGKSATDGTDIVVYPNSDVSLERFIKNGNFKTGNRFKFIERTAGVEAHRGIAAEDGLIRIEYKFEKVYPKWEPAPIIWELPKPYNPKRRKTDWWYYGNGTNQVLCNGVIPPDAEGKFCDSSDNGGVYGGVSHAFLNQNSGVEMSKTFSAGGMGGNACDVSASVSGLETKSFTSTPRERSSLRSAPSINYVENDVGVTAPGEISDQKFHHADYFPTETESHVIIMRLLGETESGKVVRKPVTVKIKPRCVSCGKQNKATSKHCSECGTYLEMV